MSNPVDKETKPADDIVTDSTRTPSISAPVISQNPSTTSLPPGLSFPTSRGLHRVPPGFNTPTADQKTTSSIDPSKSKPNLGGIWDSANGSSSCLGDQASKNVSGRFQYSDSRKDSWHDNRPQNDRNGRFDRRNGPHVDEYPYDRQNNENSRRMINSGYRGGGHQPQRDARPFSSRSHGPYQTIDQPTNSSRQMPLTTRSDRNSLPPFITSENNKFPNRDELRDATRPSIPPTEKQDESTQRTTRDLNRGMEQKERSDVHQSSDHDLRHHVISGESRNQYSDRYRNNDTNSIISEPRFDQRSDRADEFNNRSDHRRGRGQFNPGSRHNRQSYSNIEEQMNQMADMSNPERWYPEARKMKRHFVFHAGPTNSGKTHSAIDSFLKAGRGVYCCPLRLLASEVQMKSITEGVACDLVTGEERWIVNEDGSDADHVACTVYMVSTEVRYDIAVIDEIQNIGDNEKGYAYTRAILGILAEEIHVCGEETAINLIGRLVDQIGDTMDVVMHERDTELILENRSLDSDFKNVNEGDCVVCFSKGHVRSVARQLHQLGWETSKIYGAMPPSVKKKQAANFNSKTNNSKIMIATDAIGQGLNLCIRRVIFYSLRKISIDENGQRKMGGLTPSHTQHIAGRAGRKSSGYPQGHVTTFNEDDLEQMKELMFEEAPEVTHAGLQPLTTRLVKFAILLERRNRQAIDSNEPGIDTEDMTQLLSQLRGDHALEVVLKEFFKRCRMDDTLYFASSMEDIKAGASYLTNIRLNLHEKFIFSCAPIPSNSNFLYNLMRGMAELFSRKQEITAEWLKRELNWYELPFNYRSIKDLTQLEEASAAITLYNWLGNKFAAYFPDFQLVDLMQTELDRVLEDCYNRLHTLRDSSAPPSAPRPGNVHYGANRRR